MRGQCAVALGRGGRMKQAGGGLQGGGSSHHNGTVLLQDVVRGTGLLLLQ